MSFGFSPLDNTLGVIAKNSTTVGGSDQAGKYVQTNEEGVLDMSLLQSIVVNPVTGEQVSLSAVQDNDGNWVLRTVDAAPFAYNETTQRLKTESIITGAYQSVEMLMSSRTFAAGEAYNMWYGGTINTGFEADCSDLSFFVEVAESGYDLSTWDDKITLEYYHLYKQNAGRI